MYVLHAEQTHRAFRLAREYFKRFVYARAFARGETVQVRLTHPHGIRSESESLDDIDATHDATVVNHLRFLADGFADGRQDVNGRDGALQLSSAVRRHPHRVVPNISSAHRVVGTQNPFHRHRTIPLRAKPLGVFPIKRSVELFCRKFCDWQRVSEQTVALQIANERVLDAL